MNAPHPLPSLCRDNPGERIERSVGADYGADGYIARAQADELADLLELRPGHGRSVGGRTPTRDEAAATSSG